MKMAHKKAPVVAASTTTTTAATPSPATPATGGTGESVSGATTGDSAASLATAEAPVADGQLASFSRFSSKDPFLQQINDSAENDQEQAAAAAASAGSSSGSSSAAADTPSAGTSTSGSATGSDSAGGSDSSAQAASDTTVISVNGTLMAVAVGKDFPQPSSSDPGAVPLFRLVSFTSSTAKVAIVGGSYTNGAPTVTLHVNKPITLMNTADGTRYKLVLKPRGTAVTSHG
jgi:hypothetical protein